MPYHKLTAEFVINTPLFMSGADQEKAELRVSSIKGAIRFWWRALNYVKYEGNSAEKLKAMKNDEDRLFGSTKGQSQVLFSLSNSIDQVENSHLNGSQEKAKDYVGLRYLGFGVMDSTTGKLETSHAGKTTYHPYIKQNQKFTLKLISKSPIGNCIIDAIKLFGLVGNLGSKSRKGYGSVTLLSLNGDISTPWTAPTCYPSYVKKILILLRDIRNHNELPEITAFCNNSEIYYLGGEGRAIDILNDYGLMMMRYRSAGKSGIIRNYAKKISSNPNEYEPLFNSEERFWDDHQWAKGKLQSENIINLNEFHPERIIFGLPHNYDNQNREQVKPQEYERRASPLFFHVHQLSNGKYAGIALIMKSVFLPDNDEKEINADNNLVRLNIDESYSLLTDFLTGYKRDTPGVDSEEHYFPDHQKIYPLGQEEE